MVTNNKIPFVVTYHPGLPNIGRILRSYIPFYIIRKGVSREFEMYQDGVSLPEELTRLFGSRKVVTFR